MENTNTVMQVPVCGHTGVCDARCPRAGFTGTACLHLLCRLPVRLCHCQGSPIGARHATIGCTHETETTPYMRAARRHV